MTVYIGIAHKDEDTDYGIYFPDLPGCFSAGSTMDELLEMALEAVASYVETLTDDRKMVPPPSTAETLRQDEGIANDLKDGAMLVQIPLLSKSHAKQRIEFQMDKNLVDAFDRRAKALGVTRKALAEQAFEHYLRSA